MTHAALTACLHAATPPAPCSTVADWWPQWLALPADADPATLALLGGLAADRVGWAFAAGYQAALRALRPALPRSTMAALCVTEAGGNRPRDVLTTITPLPDGRVRVNGAKRWTTLGPAATLLLVVGRRAGADAERPQLQVALVPGGTPGLALQPLPGLAMVPEVPHAALTLSGVVLQADALLPGDGYDTVVKPFRTLEDLHVTLAVLAHLLRQARCRGWPSELAERLAAVAALLLTLAAQDPDAASTQVLLGGALQLARQLYADVSTAYAATPDDPASQRWARDAALFNVAGSARAQRSARAWQRLSA